MKFELSNSEVKTFQIWKNQLPPIDADIFGAEYQFEFIFYPTGLGVTKKIKRVDGCELDLTDYSNW